MKRDECEDKKEKCKTLIIDGTKYRTTFSKKYEMRKPWVKPDKKDIISFIPGTILKIFVEKGQCVKKGENLLILDAMKMQNIFKSPYEGVVKNIYLTEGERVPKGKIIMEIGYPE